MKAFHFWAFVAVPLTLIALGCANNAPPSENAQAKEARIKANLEKLDPEDREQAQEQKYCAIETKTRLGDMGKPIKLTIEEQSVFLCCKGCEKAAKQDPKATLARVEELKIQTALEQLDPADRKLAEEQKFCASEPENRLGSMGSPIKVMVKDQPVFLCCGSCRKAALKDPEKTLAAVKKLKAANASAAKESNRQSHE
ncbi:MAG: hypothetical protein ACRELF_08790 [Gemmataceae bacterium]